MVSPVVMGRDRPFDGDALFSQAERIMHSIDSAVNWDDNGVYFQVASACADQKAAS
jgi:hypothetical protein